MNNDAITVETIVRAPMSKVWEYWNNPDRIIHWAFASDDWEASDAENDLRVGGVFKTHMGAKDKSAGFDFAGTYTAVKKNELLEYDLGDKRHIRVVFSEVPEGVRIVETFDPERTNSRELQKNGWQAILDNFKNYTEGSHP